MKNTKYKTIFLSAIIENASRRYEFIAIRFRNSDVLYSHGYLEFSIYSES